MALDNLTLRDIRLILTQIEWYERAELLQLYVHLRSREEDGFSPFKAAKELNISHPVVYESLLLARFMTEDLKKLNYRDALKEVQERKRNGE